MARALRLEFEGALYHLCARGNRRERIFADEKDCERFLALLRESLRRYGVELHAYVLLPNHFHLLGRTRKANLSRWMHWLVAAYSMFFNRRHKKTGHLFQGRYKSFLVGGGDYLLGLSRYLHLNPVRGRLLGAGNPKERRKRLRSYRWSSYRGYAGLTKPSDFISEELVLGEFGGQVTQRTKLRYRRFVEEGLLREIENPFEAVQWQMVLGSESLVQKVTDKLRSKSDQGREVTGVRRSLNAASEPRELMARVAAHYGISLNKLLHEPTYGSQARNVAIWLAWQKSDLTLREIGSLFGGLDYAAVSQRIRRIQSRAATDKKLRQAFKMLNV